MALRIRCVHCKKQFPFSRGMLGTRVSCPYCNRHFLCDSMPADPAQTPVTVGAAAPVQAAGPALAASASAVRPVAAAMVDRSEADGYDLRLLDDEPAPAPAAKPAPKRQPQVAKRPAPERIDTGSYDLKPDPAPVVKPSKPAAQTVAVLAAAAATQGERKGFLARLFGRSK